MATVYDRWMDHDQVPYAEWWRFVAQLFAASGVRQGRLLDLGTGTGRMAALAAADGFEVTCVDPSPEMLAAARRRMPEGTAFIESRMQDLDFGSLGPFEAVLCCFDALNYVVDLDELARVFRGVASVLAPGSPLVFDVRSWYTLEHRFAQGSTGDVVDDFAYVWRNDFDPVTGVLRAKVSFFMPQGDGSYMRRDETHVERAHHRGTLSGLLESSGFDTVGQFDRYRDLPVRQETDRETWYVRRRAAPSGVA